MIQIRAVVFDYGNVLCYEHLESDLQAMASCLGVDLPDFKAAYWHFRLDYDAGVSNGQVYFGQIAEKCGVPISAEQARQCIDLDNIGWSRPNHVIADWAKRLRENGVKTAILSNMPQDFREFLPNCTWLTDFDHCTFSCEVKHVKPSHQIYIHCLDGLAVEPEHILFIDDRLPNVEAAQSLKWHTFHFTHADELHEFIKNTKLPSVKTHLAVS
jgi:HAD superfamily hydrolase (TIGR01509 family)